MHRSQDVHVRTARAPGFPDAPSLSPPFLQITKVIANHIMPCISFATGGSPSDYTVIGYVAKDHRNFRECHVFECGEVAGDVMATIGQAFELRYKSFLAKGQNLARTQFDALPSVPGGMPPAGMAYGGGGPIYDQAAGEIAAQRPGGSPWQTFPVMRVSHAVPLPVSSHF